MCVETWDAVRHTMAGQYRLPSGRRGRLLLHRIACLPHIDGPCSAFTQLHQNCSRTQITSHIEQVRYLLKRFTHELMEECQKEMHMSKKARSRKKAPAIGPRIVRAWFDTVINPLLNGLEKEPAIPGERQTPVTTTTSQLPFRKHPCENTPLTGTICCSYDGVCHVYCCTQRT